MVLLITHLKFPRLLRVFFPEPVPALALALLALVDDYIGGSNTNMHLRAAVGGTARVLVPCPAEWRWMNSGRSSPWFPGFSIYRQSLHGDWRPALAALKQDLEKTYLRRGPAG